MKQSQKYSPEVQERAVRMVFEHQHEHGSQWEAIVAISAKFGCTSEQYMRNDWTAAKMPMVHGHLDGKDVVLFHGGLTNT